MAVTYLAEGATSLAAANWSDATGFADNATLVINRPFGPITGGSSGLDQSGVTDGPTYLKMIGNASGQLGDASNPLKSDFNDGSSPHFLYAPVGGLLYYWPGGNETTCTEFEASGMGTYYLVGGGTVTTLRHISGIGNIGGSVIGTTLECSGGEFTADYNATAFTTATIFGGVANLRRVGTTMNIYSYATIDASAGAITTLNIYPGANVKFLQSGTITKINHYGGNIDFKNLKIGLTITDVDVYPTAPRAQWTTGNALITHTNAVNYKYRGVSGVGVFG